MAGFLKEEFLKEVKLKTRPVEKRMFELVEERISDSKIKKAMRYALTRGKRLRPALTLEACEVVGGRIEDAIPAAVAIEFAHTLTLILDDYFDRHSLRRGKEPFSKRFDSLLIELAKPWFISLSMSELQRVDRTGEMFDYYLKVSDCMASAELKREHYKKLRETPSKDIYLQNCRNMTGKLFGSSTRFGAICGRASREQIEALTRYGEDMGTAYQLKDDVIDTSEDRKMGWIAPQIDTKKQIHQLCYNGLNKLKGRGLCSDFFERFAMYVQA